MSLRTFHHNIGDDSSDEDIDRVRAGTLEIVTHAAGGEAGSCTVEIDDPDGDWFVSAYRRWIHIESEATGDDQRGILWVGNTEERTVRRAPARVGPRARTWTVSLRDINWRLSNRLMVGNDANRPAETTGERLTWLVTQTAEMEFVQDTAFVDFTHSIPLDKNDHRGQTLHEILATIAREVGYDFFLFNAPTEGHPLRYGLFFNAVDAAINDATLRITNDLDDVDNVTTFAAAYDSSYRYESSRVYSQAYTAYDGGWVWEQRAQTIGEFAKRGGVFPAPHIKSRAKARRFARQQLIKSSTEEEILSTGILVPPSLVNGAMAGQRIQVKFTHLDGLEDWTWLRAEKRTVRHQDDGSYWLLFDLSTDSAGEVVGCSGLTESQTFYPLGGTGNTANPSPTGNVVYLIPGMSYITDVTPGHQGTWHFPEFGTGGSGTIDYAGDCTQSRLRILVVGDGTLTINTEQYGGAGRTLEARLMHYSEGADVTDEVQTETSGDTFTFSIDTHGGVHCTHYVDVRDNGATCGGKWGWSSAEWVAA